MTATSVWQFYMYIFFYCPVTYASLHREDDQTYQNIFCVSPNILSVSAHLSVFFFCEYEEFEEFSQPVKEQPVPF